MTPKSSGSSEVLYILSYSKFRNVLTSEGLILIWRRT